LRRTADTEAFYTEVQTEILKKYGKEFTWDLKVKMMGKKSMESARILVEECNLEGILSPEAFLKQREEMLHALFPSTKLMPGKCCFQKDRAPGCLRGHEGGLRAF